MDEEYRNDISSNSVSGFTLGTSDTARAFDRFNFLDTLRSYVTQSRMLGWIRNQLTADTYANLIDSVRARLRGNDDRLARYSLDSVMAHIVSDSSSVVSSEAFALIFFNTQYLLSRLPAPTYLPPKN
jgi:hypothetical protein